MRKLNEAWKRGYFCRVTHAKTNSKRTEREKKKG